MSATDGDTAAAASNGNGLLLLDELTPKQRLKEFKSVQKALHSKDFAARLAVLPKLTTDARYFTEGQCLPAFLESLAPNKVPLSLALSPCASLCLPVPLSLTVTVTVASVA